MKIIKEGDFRVVSILKKKNINPDSLYRLSVYTIPFSEKADRFSVCAHSENSTSPCAGENDAAPFMSAAGADAVPCAEERVHFLHNTLTGITASLSDEEWTVIQRGSAPIKGSVLREAGLSDLITLCLLTEPDTDDYQQYKTVISLLKIMEKKKPGVKTYTILPTTGCNARCVYCYEEGLPVLTMDEATADQTVDFIERTRRKDKIILTWFGGEPLLGEKIISRICRKLSDRGVKFKSRIITNACLLTPELAEKAALDWHLESAQVSVDGARTDYESRKQYLNPAKHNYDTMLQGIGYLLKQNIQVTLRCNYDRNNLEGMRTLWDDAVKMYGTSGKLSIYTAMLFQEKVDRSCVHVYEKMKFLENEAALSGLPTACFRKDADKLKVNMCMADSEGKSVVITPDGTLYHCEHLPDNTSFGHITDADVRLESDSRALLEADEKCRNCPYLPECTPFFRNGCPVYNKFCAQFRQIDTESKLRKLIYSIY